jgi:hypothetical protein
VDRSVGWQANRIKFDPTVDGQTTLYGGKTSFAWSIRQVGSSQKQFSEYISPGDGNCPTRFHSGCWSLLVDTLMGWRKHTDRQARLHKNFGRI